MMLFSIVVCTYNRANILKKALESLIGQELNKSEYEIIVIDNNSSDNTHNIVNEFLSCGNVIYKLEKKQGVVNAANTGWVISRGTYIGFFDDDAIAPNNWLSFAKKIVIQKAPQAFGGPYDAYYITDKPVWFKNDYGSSPQINCHDLITKYYLNGTNVFYRRTIFDEIGGFNSELGMVGNQIGYGFEPEFQNRIKNNIANAKIYYDPKLLVHHLVKPEKMNLLWNIKQRFADGCYTQKVFGDNMLNNLKIAQEFIRVFLTAMHLLKDISFGVLLRDRIKYPYYQNYYYEYAFRHFITLGHIYEKIKFSKNYIKT